MKAKLRVSSSSKLAASHEKDLSTSQSQTGANPRISREDGHSGRPQRPPPPPRKGTGAARYLDSPEATRIEVPLREYRFSPAARLHRRVEFLSTQRAGLRWQTPHFVIYASATGNPATRLGVTVSRKVGNAVERNTLKRRIRESFRLKLRDMAPIGTDLVIIVRASTGASQLAFKALVDELSRGVARVIGSNLP